MSWTLSVYARYVGMDLHDSSSSRFPFSNNIDNNHAITGILHTSTDSVMKTDVDIIRIKLLSISLINFILKLALKI